MITLHPQIYTKPHFLFGRSLLQHVTAHMTASANLSRPHRSRSAGPARQPRMEGKEAQICGQRIRPRPAGLAHPTERDSQGTAWRLRAPPARTPWPAEAAWNRPGAVPSLLIPGRWTKLAGPPAPSSPTTQPREGLALPSTRPYSVAKRTSFSSGQIDSFAYVPRPKSNGPEAELDPIQMGPAQRRFQLPQEGHR